MLLCHTVTQLDLKGGEIFQILKTLWFLFLYTGSLHTIKVRSRRLRPKAHILDDPLGNPYAVLKVLLGPPYGPRAHRVALKGHLKRHKGCPRGHLRCKLWVLIGDFSLYDNFRLYFS